MMKTKFDTIITLVGLALILTGIGVALSGCSKKDDKTPAETRGPNDVTMPDADGTVGDKIWLDPFGDLTILSSADAVASVQAAAEMIDLCTEELTVAERIVMDELVYYRMDLHHRGIPVLGDSVILITNTEGRAKALFKHASAVYGITDVSPTLTQDQARMAVDMYATKFIAETEGAESHAISIPPLQDHMLVIYNRPDTADGASVLAYDVYASVDRELWRFVLDAKSGTVLLAYSTAQNAGATITTTDHTGALRENITVSKQKEEGRDVYYLRDEARNIEIIDAGGSVLLYEIYDEKNALLINKNGEFTSAGGFTLDYRMCTTAWYTEDEGRGRFPASFDAQWSDAKKGVTLLANTRLTYDFFETRLGIRGTDPTSPNTKIVCSYDDNRKGSTNAYTWGLSHTAIHAAQFGFGSEHDLSIDAIAHEYMHAVMDRITVMNHTGESGAILEGYADVFGELVENWAVYGDCDWENARRNMRSPAPAPHQYGGSGYILYAEPTAENDFGYVHGNSTVISHAAYNMVEGEGLGGEELNYNELAELWYRTLYVLPFDCNFADLRVSMEATAKLMGLSSAKQERVTAAFDQAQIPQTIVCLKESFYLTVMDGEKLFRHCTVRADGMQYAEPADIPYEREIATGLTENPIFVTLPKGHYLLTLTDHSDHDRVLRVWVRIVGERGEGALAVHLDQATGIPLETLPETDSPDIPETTPPSPEETNPPETEPPVVENPIATLIFTDNGDNTCTVSGIHMSEFGDVVIPACSPDGLTVTAIGAYAFKSCMYMTGVEIPDSVTRIGNYAFYECNNLRKVAISDIIAWCRMEFGNGPANPVHYARNLYVNGKPLTELVIPRGVTAISDFAFNYCDTLTSVTLSGGITTIGEYAFSHCAALERVSLPDSVTEIGRYAFTECPQLSAIDLPESLSAIGVDVFSGCKSLQSLTIPSSVTSIGYAAFAHCTGLTEVTLPAGLTSIGGSAFEDCTALGTVRFRGKLENWEAVRKSSAWHQNAGMFTVFCTNGHIEPDGTTVAYPSEGLLYSSNGNGTCYVIGMGDCTDTRLVIPAQSPDGDTVTRIMDGAFRDCTDLVSVTLPDTVTRIGGSAFYGCTDLVSIHIPKSVSIINKHAFNGCASLTEVIIPDGMTVLSASVFRNCTSLRSISLPGTLAIVEEGQEEQIAIEEQVFDGCVSLETVTFRGTSAQWAEIKVDSAWNQNTPYYIVHCTEDDAYIAKNGTVMPSPSHGLAYIPSGVGTCTVSGPGTCIDADVVIPMYSPNGDLVTKIAANAFAGCGNLTSITIPAGVTTIGRDAFTGCEKLTAVYITDLAGWCTMVFDNDMSNPLYYAEDLYFHRELLTAVTIPDEVTAVSDRAFYYCKHLTKVTIPAHVKTIGAYAFAGCGELTNLSVSNGTESIGAYAFAWCTNLSKVSLPESMTAIGSSAFTGCSTLSSLSLPRYLTQVSDGAFSYCASLTELTIPRTVTDIGASAFRSCTSLVNLRLSANLATIGEAAFADCASLAVVSLPEFLTSVEKSAFEGCTALEEVRISNLTLFSQIRFASATANPLHRAKALYVSDRLITELRIPTNVPAIGSYAFSGYQGLVSLTVLDGATVIGEGAFGGCDELLTVTIADTVGEIGAGAFASCTKLAAVRIPSAVASIPADAFADCVSLRAVTIPTGVTRIVGNAFNGAANLRTILYEGSTDAWNDMEKQPDWYAGTDDFIVFCTDGDIARDGTVTAPTSKGLLYLSNGNGTCYLNGIGDCTDTDVIVPKYSPAGDVVTRVHDAAFKDCTALTGIVLPDTMIRIGGSAFYGCSALTHIVMPGEISVIGKYAFRGCTSLVSITLPDALTAITQGAFRDCTSLTTVTIGSHVTSIADRAFGGCTSLVTIAYRGTSVGWDAVEKDPAWDRDAGAYTVIISEA